MTVPGNQRFILAVQLTQPERFREIFGEAIVKFAYVDMTYDIQLLSEVLLQKYQCYGSIASSYFGRWYRVFSPKASLMSFDMAEQIPLLQEVGTAKMHELLITNFGQATGSRQNFRLLILPAPELLDEKSINQAIDDALKLVADASLLLHGNQTREILQRLIEQDQLQCYFQPIFSLADQKIVGYEALSRGPADSVFYTADALFTAARQFGMTQALEFACLKQAINWLTDIPKHLWISVNLGPDLFMSDEFQQYLSSPHIKPLLSRIVFELTEHLPIESAVKLHSVMADFRNNGLKLSLDDTGCGFFDMTTVEELRPAIVKLCITVISRIGRKDGVEQEMSETIRAITALGGLTLGEGVENAYQAEVLKQCGATLVQGNLFGLPKPAKELFLTERL
ncbi:EAL domain-containing protein [Nitrosomonas sp. Nm33]|uniref:EAL domain-containing protein n=1 Tax=Nitrosomonas sp. Nm33 TaxID=133724 RepID=UPI0008943496|nr:EAL domain-containing protein [Nitrosomonas sp. Nm33]SDY41780.1 EAL domain, c-di-GMP-specific phosphodiesterase class I (or its enzymatically inactive variant) [Nitrosomonas sp. Nm33]